MAYTKPAQAAFAANLAAGEFVVTLDTGQSVAVHVCLEVEPNTGNPVVKAAARVVNADGTDYHDASGNPIKTGFGHTSSSQEMATLGGTGSTQAQQVAALTKQAYLAVLGEPTQLWGDPIHTGPMQDASIRVNIASHANAGTVTNAGGIL
ncbi:MAG: hypothetical protein JSR70_09480 [Proteobacteria bacterium]|nr:hypothetical protein [Pseudomonadota bacterium]